MIDWGIKFDLVPCRDSWRQSKSMLRGRRGDEERTADEIGKVKAKR